MEYLYNNKVIFTGDQDNLNRVLNLFQTMIEQENKGVIGQMPDFLESDENCFLEIFQYEAYECAFHYDTTRENPNIEALRMIANCYNVGFVLEYSEFTCMVYGKTIYDGQILRDYRLTQTDLEQITYNTETDKYEFNGKSYQWHSEIVEILLERKVYNNEKN